MTMIKAPAKAKETSRGTGRVCFTLGLNLGSQGPNEQRVRAPWSQVLTKTVAGSSKKAARGRACVAGLPSVKGTACSFSMSSAAC